MESWVKDFGSEDSRIVISVGTRETDKFIWTRFTGSTTADFELRAGRIEFGSAHAIAEMKSDDFVTNEVIAWCNVVWKGYFGGLTLFLEKLH